MSVRKDTQQCEQNLKLKSEEWDELWEGKQSVVNGVLALFRAAAVRDYSFVITQLCLLGVACLILYFNPNPYGILGATIVALMMMVMGLTRKHAKNRKEEAGDQQTQSGDESKGPKELGTAS